MAEGIEVAVGLPYEKLEAVIARADARALVGWLSRPETLDRVEGEGLGEPDIEGVLG